MRISLLFVLVLGACAGDEVDTGNAPLCTKALYDTCITEHDCMVGDCHNFEGDGFMTCTQGCTAAVPCPDQDGVPVPCNGMGICKPAMAKDCRVVP